MYLQKEGLDRTNRMVYLMQVFYPEAMQLLLSCLCLVLTGRLDGKWTRAFASRNIQTVWDGSFCMVSHYFLFPVRNHRPDWAILKQLQSIYAHVLLERKKWLGLKMVFVKQGKNCAGCTITIVSFSSSFHYKRVLSSNKVSWKVVTYVY